MSEYIVCCTRTFINHKRINFILSTNKKQLLKKRSKNKKLFNYVSRQLKKEKEKYFLVNSKKYLDFI